MKIKIVFWFLLLSSIAKAEDITQITIIDTQGYPIAYVNITLPNDNGTISDNYGRFIMGKKLYQDSTILFSHIGYQPLSILIRNLQDTIILQKKDYLLKGVEISALDLNALLSKSLNNFTFKEKATYQSKRMIACKDSLVFYSERKVRLRNIDLNNGTLDQKELGYLEYNVASKDLYNLNFSLIQVLSKNPYIILNKNKEVLLNNLKLIAESDDYYCLESQDSTSITTMYIDKKTSRLVRLEKIFTKPIIDKASESKNISYVTTFGVEPNGELCLQTFRYHLTCYPFNTSESYECLMFDNLVSDTKKEKDIQFNSLSELKEYKQNDQTIETELYKYFKPSSDSLTLKKIITFEYTEPQIPTINYSFNTGFVAVYDPNISTYNYYPANTNINFNIYSPRVQNQHFYPNKIDSFNPYGSSTFSNAIIGGLSGFLKMIK